VHALVLNAIPVDFTDLASGLAYLTAGALFFAFFLVLLLLLPITVALTLWQAITAVREVEQDENNRWTQILRGKVLIGPKDLEVGSIYAHKVCFRVFHSFPPQLTTVLATLGLTSLSIPGISKLVPSAQTPWFAPIFQHQMMVLAAAAAAAPLNSDPSNTAPVPLTMTLQLHSHPIGASVSSQQSLTSEELPAGPS